jgi:hypothetical protein
MFRLSNLRDRHTDCRTWARNALASSSSSSSSSLEENNSIAFLKIAIMFDYPVVGSLPFGSAVQMGYPPFFVGHKISGRQCLLKVDGMVVFRSERSHHFTKGILKKEASVFWLIHCFVP